MVLPKPIKTARVVAVACTHAPVRVARFAGLAGVAIYGTWLISTFRDAAAGVSAIPMSMLIALLYVLPLALLPLLGLRAGLVLRYAFLVVAVSLLVGLV